MNLILTDDGSHTLYRTDLNETYHSRDGAIHESLHVFIAAGLKPLLDAREEVKILEVGFGTGLNALLTCNAAEYWEGNIHYTAVEANPIPLELALGLNFCALLDRPELLPVFRLLHSVSDNKPTRVTDKFLFNKRLCQIEDIQLANTYDLVYFDAFAPEKQPEMWSRNIFEKIHDALAPNGRLVTYCAKGEVKRTLKSLEFVVETLPGAGRKREMIRAYVEEVR